MNRISASPLDGFGFITIALADNIPTVPVANEPIPERFSVNGEPVTLLGIDTVPVNVPVDNGLNTTVKLVVPPAGTELAGSVPVIWNGPVTVNEPRDNAALPVLVIVNTTPVLVFP